MKVAAIPLIEPARSVLNYHARTKHQPSLYAAGPETLSTRLDHADGECFMQMGRKDEVAIVRNEEFRALKGCVRPNRRLVFARF